MNLLCCLSAIGIAILGLEKPIVDYSGLALLCSTFLASAVGGKILQKRIEVDGAKADITVDNKPN